MLSVALPSALRPRGRRRTIPVGLLVLSLVAAFGGCSHSQDSRLQYLANEGVAVFHEETTLLFDPLFRTDYGIYTLVPEEVREAMFNGSAPFDRITAVFVSHYHDDHFDPGDMLTLLGNHAQTRLYAPRQAIDAMRRVAATSDLAVFDRTVAIDLAYKDEPQSFVHAGILVEAFFVPHAGWPVRRTDVQNIAFRVTVGEEATVVHLGDADPNLIHFEDDKEAWHRRRADAALPPYWFFNSSMGNQILADYLRPRLAIGIHVPSSYSGPDGIPGDLEGYDLFMRPGETRDWAGLADSAE